MTGRPDGRGNIADDCAMSLAMSAGDRAVSASGAGCAPPQLERRQVGLALKLALPLAAWAPGHPGPAGLRHDQTVALATVNERRL